MIKRFIVALLVVAVIAIAANDTWRYLGATQAMREASFALAQWAGQNAASLTRDQAAGELAAQAQAAGVRLVMYDQKDGRARIWVEKDVEGTIVAGTVNSLLVGESFGVAVQKPLVISDYREARFAN